MSMAARATAIQMPTPLKVNSISRKNDDEILIRWSGGTTPVSVSAMHYFNDNHNEGISKCHVINGLSNNQNKTGTISYIAPGQRYWIKLTDANGTSAWYDYSDPVGNEPDIKVSLKEIHFSSFSYESYSTYSVRNVTAKKIEKTSCRNSPTYDSSADDIHITVTLNIGKLENARKVKTSWILIMPNEDVFNSGVAHEYFEKSGVWLENNGMPWDEIYKIMDVFQLENIL